MEVTGEGHEYVVLYVEDDPEARDLVQTAISLKFPNLKLLMAENGKVGLELYKQHKPDMVLTDIRMPVMDGLAMAAEIRSLRPDAVIAVVSAYCDTEYFAASADRIRINHYVTKPLNYKALFDMIEKVLSERRGLHGTA